MRRLKRVVILLVSHRNLSVRRNLRTWVCVGAREAELLMRWVGSGFSPPIALIAAKPYSPV